MEVLQGPMPIYSASCSKLGVTQTRSVGTIEQGVKIIICQMTIVSGFSPWDTDFSVIERTAIVRALKGAKRSLVECSFGPGRITITAPTKPMRTEVHCFSLEAS